MIWTALILTFLQILMTMSNLLMQVWLFLGTFIIVFFVPETKGKSPEEMKAYFEKKTVKSEKRW